MLTIHISDKWFICRLHVKKFYKIVKENQDDSFWKKWQKSWIDSWQKRISKLSGNIWKRCLTSLAITEMQIKTAMRYNCIYVWCLKWNGWRYQALKRIWSHQNSLTVLFEMQIGTTTLGNWMYLLELDLHTLWLSNFTRISPAEPIHWLDITFWNILGITELEKSTCRHFF